MDKNDKGSLCWNCKNALGGCSWSKSYVPIKGWKAIRSDVKTALHTYVESYFVLECPEYVKEKR